GGATGMAGGGGWWRRGRRRWARRAVPLDRWRVAVLVGPWAVEPPAPPSMGPRRRRSVPAHDPRGPGVVGASPRRHLHRWRVPVRRRREDVAGQQYRHQLRAPARPRLQLAAMP